MMFGDRGISNFEEDKLNFEKVINSLYESIEYLYNLQKGAVIAIIGSWGIGKTSALNLLSKKYNIGESNSPIFKLDAVDYSDFKYLIFEVLKIINKRFLPLDNNEIRELFFKFTSLSLFTLDIISNFYDSPLLKIIGNILKVSKNTIEHLPEESLSEIKGQLKEKLKGKSKKLIIVIDDIDRMDSKEFLAVLKLIREFAELPNIFFILSISEESIAKNQQFISKYIEFPFYFPALNLESFLRDFLNTYMEFLGLQQDEQDERKKNEIVILLLNTYIKTPRDIKRLINTLYMERELYKNVYIYDLILLTSIKVFDIESYIKIRNWILYKDADEDSLAILLERISLESEIILSYIFESSVNIDNFHLRKQKHFYIKDFRKNYFTYEQGSEDRS